MIGHKHLPLPREELDEKQGGFAFFIIAMIV